MTAAEKQRLEWGGQSLADVFSGQNTQSAATGAPASKVTGIGKTDASHFLANRTRGKPV